MNERQGYDVNEGKEINNTCLPVAGSMAGLLWACPQHPATQCISADWRPTLIAECTKTTPVYTQIPSSETFMPLETIKRLFLGHKLFLHCCELVTKILLN